MLPNWLYDPAELFRHFDRVGIFTPQGLRWLSKEELIHLQGPTQDFYVNLWCER